MNCGPRYIASFCRAVFDTLQTIPSMVPLTRSLTPSPRTCYISSRAVSRLRCRGKPSPSYLFAMFPFPSPLCLSPTSGDSPLMSSQLSLSTVQLYFLPSQETKEKEGFYPQHILQHLLQARATLLLTRCASFPSAVERFHSACQKEQSPHTEARLLLRPNSARPWTLVLSNTYKVTTLSLSLIANWCQKKS